MLWHYTSTFYGCLAICPNSVMCEIRRYCIATEIYTEDSVLIGKFYNENRTPVKFSEISKNAVDALIATEDVRFYKHHGLDLFALAGGVYSTTKGDERGASTITQQLAKNMYTHSQTE
ncbi:MAG: biosynthetic peptidoglycan transglycosylase [Bacteroidia bacterium]